MLKVNKMIEVLKRKKRALERRDHEAEEQKAPKIPKLNLEPLANQEELTASALLCEEELGLFEPAMSTSPRGQSSTNPASSQGDDPSFFPRTTTAPLTPYSEVKRKAEEAGVKLPDNFRNPDVYTPKRLTRMVEAVARRQKEEAERAATEQKMKEEAETKQKISEQNTSEQAVPRRKGKKLF